MFKNAWNRALMLTVAALVLMESGAFGGGLGNIGGVSGGGSHSSGAVKKPKPSEPLLVKSVDLAAKTVTIQRGSQEPEVCTVDKFTRVYVDGKSGKIGDITPGMKIDVTFGICGKTASRMDVTSVKH